MASPTEYHYDKFPPSNIDWAELIALIGPANAALARYDGLLTAIPNAGVLLSPLTTQEAVLSSKIEGTITTMGEVLEYEAEGAHGDLPNERKEDFNEVLNYRKAMWHGIELLKDLPLCQRVIKGAHQVLLDGVRGHGKSPGEYRKTPNWIGPPGCSIEDARYVPISVDRLQSGMDIWEKYIHEEVPDKIVQLAIMHAEFEALHPFLDGNGRLGRMCVPLFMYKVGLINSPMFYVSAFFEANRDEYYARLAAVSKDDEWTEWCNFFLTAVIEQAEDNQEKASNILSLYDSKKGQIAKLTHSQYAIHALDFIFSQPVFSANLFTNQKHIPTPTAKRILSLLKKNNILRVLRNARGRRPAIYMFPELINASEGKELF